MHGGGDLGGGEAVDVLAEAGVDEDVEPGDGYYCGYLWLEMGGQWGFKELGWCEWKG